MIAFLGHEDQVNEVGKAEGEAGGEDPAEDGLQPGKGHGVRSALHAPLFQEQEAQEGADQAEHGIDAQAQPAGEGLQVPLQQEHIHHGAQDGSQLRQPAAETGQQQVQHIGDQGPEARHRHIQQHIDHREHPQRPGELGAEGAEAEEEEGQQQVFPQPGAGELQCPAEAAAARGGQPGRRTGTIPPA